MRNVTALRDYNRRKRNARLDIEDFGLETVRYMHAYGERGNGTNAYERGYSDYITYQLTKAFERGV